MKGRHDLLDFQITAAQKTCQEIESDPDTQGGVLPLREAMGNGGKGRKLLNKGLASYLSRKGEITKPAPYFRDCLLPN